MLVWNINREREMLDPDSLHVLYVQNYMSQRAVDESDIPRFSFDELSLTESLKNAALNWMLLALELAVALILGFALFAHARLFLRRFEIIWLVDALTFERIES
jgi:hypothetical protein